MLPFRDLCEFGTDIFVDCDQMRALLKIDIEMSLRQSFVVLTHIMGIKEFDQLVKRRK